MNRGISVRHLVAILAAVVVGMLFFGLRPKGLTLENQVAWVKGPTGLEIGDYGTVYADISDLVPTLTASGDYSIELAVRPSSHEGGNFKSLLMLHGGVDQHQLILGQWKSALIVMNGDDYDNSRRNKRLVSKDAVKAGAVRLIGLVTRGGRTDLFIDGERVATHNDLKLRIPQDKGRTFLVVGNSVYGKNGWDGQVLGLAIFAHALETQAIRRHYRNWSQAQRLALDRRDDALLHYPFDERSGNQVRDVSPSDMPLLIPSKVTVLKRAFLMPPWHNFRLKLPMVIDIILNFFGFAPLGLVCMMVFSRVLPLGSLHCAWAAVCVCLVLSLGIESIQMWMPSRSSSMLDLILNTAGGAAGVGLWFTGQLKHSA